MDDEKLFEMAVRLVEANINAGQFRDTLNIETIAHDQVTVTFQALEKAWAELTSDDAIH